jgi:uncharacterized protein
MQKLGGSFALTATDLVGYLNCRHLFELDRAVAEGRLGKPKAFDPLLQILWERGAAHERNYLDHLAQAGLDVVRIDGIGLGVNVISETLAAMKKGTAVIAQGTLAYQGWGGMRRSTPSLPVKRKLALFSNFASIPICSLRRRALHPSTCTWSHLVGLSAARLPLC